MRALTLLAVLLLVGLGAPAYADDAADCNGHDDYDSQIAACTRLLTGTKAGKERARILGLRGKCLCLQT